MDAAHWLTNDRRRTMFGKKRSDEAWQRDTAALGMSDTDDWEEALGGSLTLLTPHTETVSEPRKVAGMSKGIGGYVTTVDAKVRRGSVNSSVAAVGVIGAFMVSYRITQRGKARNSREHKPQTQVVVARLKRAVEGSIRVAPYYVASATKVQGEKQEQKTGLRPLPLGHDLLCTHWLSISGSAESELLATDEALSALLWTTRCKVPREKDKDPAQRARLESIVPPTSRITDFEMLEIKGDLIALARQYPWPSTGLNSDVVSLLRHATAYFR
jgi:hypothetical protein